MKVRIEKFCNTQRFRMYAVLFKKSLVAKWRYVTTMKGDKALFNKEDADKVAELINSGEYEKYESNG